MPSKWANFLNSLATSGGNLFLLAAFSLVLLFTTIYLMVHFGPGAPAVITVVGSFSAFTGAMIGILRGSRAESVPPNTSIDQTTVTKTSVPIDEPKKP